MVVITEEMIKQFETLMDKADELLKKTFQNMHNGYPKENLVRFLKARDGNLANAHKMLIDCLYWRIQNEIDNILAKPINPSDLCRAIRDSQLIGLSGYSKEGFPVIAVGVGRSTYDKASIHYYVQSHIQLNEYRDRVIMPNVTKKFGRYIGTCIKILDMTGLKISALNQIKLLSVITAIDDLNYPERTETYYIVNAPYIFSACWKVVRPLLQERTRKKVQVLSGSGRDELLKGVNGNFDSNVNATESLDSKSILPKIPSMPSYCQIMDYESLPHFCRREASGSSRDSVNGATSDCFSLDHPFHQQLYSYVKEQFAVVRSTAPLRHGSFHVDFPEHDPDPKIVQAIESEFQKIGNQNGICQSLEKVKLNGD